MMLDVVVIDLLYPAYPLGKINLIDQQRQPRLSDMVTMACIWSSLITTVHVYTMLNGIATLCSM